MQHNNYYYKLLFNNLYISYFGFNYYKLLFYLNVNCDRNNLINTYVNGLSYYSA